MAADATVPDLSRHAATRLRGFLRDMLLIRRFEERCAQLYGLRRIGGFCHLYIGQEAVAVGAVGALDLARDYVVTAYRDHGHALACGMDPGAVMAELLGREGGCSRGKGGSMHLFDAARHFLGGNGIVGAQIPVATGVAFRIAYRGEDGVVLCFFGDGAIHQGAFHESLNLAAIWKLPIVYLCENNQYGMGTDFRRVSSVHDLSALGASYGLPGAQVNGMDVLAVHDGVAAAVARAREEKRASLLEIRTYRYKGHSMSDPGKYRSAEEVDSYRRQDPIVLLRVALEAAGQLDAAAWEMLETEVAEAVDAAVAFAEQSPEPSLASLHEDVLAP